MKTKRTLRIKRDEAVATAKSFAATGHYDMAKKYMTRAAGFMPLSPLQPWAIKMIIGDYKFEELRFHELPIQADRP